MGRSSRAAKSGERAEREAGAVSSKLGRMLKDARLTSGVTQRVAAHRAGLTQATWSWLEISGDPRVTISTWFRAGLAVGVNFKAYFATASAADRPRDATHLGGQNLVIVTALPGGWRSLPEHPIDRMVQSSRSADVLLQRGFEYALADIWDWFDDVGGAERAWHRRLDAVERYAISRMAGDSPLPKASGFWVVRATVRNRQVVGDNRHFFAAAFQGSGEAWLDALARSDKPMPSDAALLWINVKGDRLFPSRLR